MAADPKQIKKRFDALKVERAIYEGHCQDVAAVVLPYHTGFTGTRLPHEKRMATVYDPAGIQANELLAAALHGLATNPATKWFTLKSGTALNRLEAVAKWLGDVADAMREQMYAPRTNIITGLHECYLELGAFGTTVMFIGERDAGGLLFQPRPLHECYLAENHEGAVDTVYRKTLMTARQIVQQWPKTASEDVHKLIEAGKPDEKVEIVHAVYPRSDRERGKRNKVNQPYASCYVEVKTEHLLEEGGFPEFPYAVARWAKLPGDVYGTSPAMTALADIKMLQEMKKTTIKAAQKIVDPTLMVPDDGAVGPIRTVPGGLIFMRDPVGRPIVPLATGGNIPLSREMMQDIRDSIRRTFFADLMQIDSDADMTATEYVQRTAERMRLLGPIIGRIGDELLAPAIDRVFGIMTRHSQLPPIPDELIGQSYSVEYTSPIAMAQKATEANAFTQTMGTLAPYIQLKGDPSVLASFKEEDLVPWLWSLYGGDQDRIKTKEELAEEQEQAQQQQQLLLAAQAAQPMAQAANQGASAIDKMASAQQKGADMSQMFGQAA